MYSGNVKWRKKTEIEKLFVKTKLKLLCMCSGSDAAPVPCKVTSHGSINCTTLQPVFMAFSRVYGAQTVCTNRKKL